VCDKKQVTAYPSRAPGFNHSFTVGFVLLILLFTFMVFNATFNDIFYLYRGCQFYPYPISFLYCCFVVIVFVLCLVPNIARDFL